MRKQLILLDLDGVLNTYCGIYNPNVIPPIRNGAKEFIIKLAQNYNLKLFTNRNSELAKKWLKENGIDQYFLGVTNNKGPAFIYIDDRALTFNGNFEETLLKIYAFKPFWKK